MAEENKTSLTGNEFIDKYRKPVSDYIESFYPSSARSVEAKTIIPRSLPLHKNSVSLYYDMFDENRVKQALHKYIRKEEKAINFDKYRNLTFVEKLILYANEKQQTFPEVYKKANLDRRLFSKMLSTPNYNPSKDTAIALVLALELNLENATDMLNRAGYALSHSDRRDIIIEYFIREGIYDIYKINVFLYSMQEKPLGRNPE